MYCDLKQRVSEMKKTWGYMVLSVY